MHEDGYEKDTPEEQNENHFEEIEYTDVPAEETAAEPMERVEEASISFEEASFPQEAPEVTEHWQPEETFYFDPYTGEKIYETKAYESTYEAASSVSASDNAEPSYTGAYKIPTQPQNTA